MAIPGWARSVASAIAGRVLQALGFLFYLGGVGGVIVILNTGHKVTRYHLSCGEMVLALGGLLLGAGLSLLLVVGGHRLLLLGKRLIAKQQENVSRRLVKELNQPIVLYLRSFRDDEATATTPTAYVYRGVSFPRLSTEEEHLARAVRGLGQLLAIAEPGTLPHAGALRLPAGPSQWQDTVRELMQRARLVLVRIGGGVWLWWETEQALALVPRERLVFLIPRNDAVWESFRQKLEATTQHSIPDLVDVIPVDASLAALLSFAPDGSPMVEPLRDAGPRASHLQPLRPMLRIALRPVFERLLSSAA